MSREPKKSRQGQEMARKLHLARQAVRNAMARIRNGETVAMRVDVNGETRTVTVGYHPSPSDARGQVVALAGGRVRLGTNMDKDGFTFATRGQNYRIPLSQVLGVVVSDKECPTDEESDPG